MSLKHCQIEQKETDKEIQAWLVDLNSSNGCIINLTDKIRNNVKIFFLKDRFNLKNYFFRSIYCLTMMLFILFTKKTMLKKVLIIKDMKNVLIIYIYYLLKICHLNSITNPKK